MKKFAILFSAPFFFISSCFADLNNCNGTWTNKACDTLGKLPEPKKEQASDPDKSKKESLIHDLRMLAIESKREYDIRYDINITEKTCKNSSLEECDKAVKNSQKDLQELKTKAQLVKTKKERNELIKESNKLRKERNEIEATKPTVVIQQNNILVPRRRPLIWRDDINGNTFKSSITTTDAVNDDQSSSLPTNEVLPE